MKSIALLWNRGMRPLSIIACLVLEHKGKSRSSALTGNSDWTGSWGHFGGVWHLALHFDENFIKFWYPHLQWFQRSTDNCGKIHVHCSDNSGTPYITITIWQSSVKVCQDLLLQNEGTTTPQKSQNCLSDRTLPLVKVKCIGIENNGPCPALPGQ